MKASTFIQVALIDQMQQIADLGLWYHLTTLIGKGINTVVAIGFPSDNSERMKKQLFPDYDQLPEPGTAWESYEASPGEGIWLLSLPGEEKLHKTYHSDGRYQIFVPSLFEDYLRVARQVMELVEASDSLNAEMVREK